VTGRPLSGGTFTLPGTDFAGRAVVRTATAVKGGVLFEDLPLGSYTITETTPPHLYQLNPMVITVTVAYNEDKTGTLVTISDTVMVDKMVDFTDGGSGSPVGTIELMKTDDSGAPLAGAQFGLYSAGGALVATATSGSSGTVTFTDVAYGSYTIRSSARRAATRPPPSSPRRRFPRRAPPQRQSPMSS
jgi:uncharacterized surface anchored protein